MSVGINVFRNDGQIAYSTDDVTWNQAGMLLVPANGSMATNCPAIAGREVLVVQIPIDPPFNNQPTIAHTITVAGISVSVSGGNMLAYVIILMR